MKIFIPKALALSGGKYNSQIHDWRIEGETSVKTNGSIEIDLDNFFASSLSQLFEIVGDGGEVTGLPTFMVIASEQLGNEIPEGLPDRTYVAEKGVKHIRTWLTWHDSVHKIRYSVDSSKAAFGLNPFGIDLKLSEVKLIEDAGIESVELFLTVDYKELMQTEEWKREEQN